MRTGKIFITFIFIIYFHPAFSQSDTIPRKQKIVISISGGAGVPIGNYAYFSKDIQENRFINIAGGAKIGVNGNITIRYYFRKNYSVNLSTIYVSNKTKMVPQDSLFPDYAAPGGGNYSVSYLYSAESWNSASILLGVSKDFGEEDLTFIINLSGGFQRIQSPAVRIDQTDYYHVYYTNSHGYQSFSVSQDKIASNNFVLAIGTSIRYKPGKHIGITWDLGCLISYSSFDGKLYYSGPSINIDKINPIHFERNTSALYANLGISYSII